MSDKLSKDASERIKKRLRLEFKTPVDDQLLDSFWSPFTLLQSDSAPSSLADFESFQQRATVKQKLATSGQRQNLSFGIFIVLSIIVFIITFPNILFAGLLIFFLFMLWAHIAHKYLKVKITSYDKFVLMDLYQEKAEKWQYEYLILRERLLEAAERQDETEELRYLREMVRYLRQGIRILNQPRILDN